MGLDPRPLAAVCHAVSHTQPTHVLRHGSSCWTGETWPGVCGKHRPCDTTPVLWTGERGPGTGGDTKCSWAQQPLPVASLHSPRLDSPLSVSRPCQTGPKDCPGDLAHLQEPELTPVQFLCSWGGRMSSPTRATTSMHHTGLCTGDSRHTQAEPSTVLQRGVAAFPMQVGACEA